MALPSGLLCGTRASARLPLGCGFRAVGLIFASSRVHAASLGPKQGRSWGPTRCAGLTARAGLVQTTLLVKGGQRHGSCPGCRISLGRCVHRPDGVGWDDFLPLLIPSARGYGPGSLGTARTGGSLPCASVSPSPSLSFCLVSFPGD